MPPTEDGIPMFVFYEPDSGYRFAWDARSPEIVVFKEDQVVDAFYLCDADGQKLTDPDVWSEVERAVLHAITTG